MARGSTADVSIKVVANAAGVNAGLSQAERRLGKFGANAKAAGKAIAGSFKGLVAPLAAGASVAGLVSAIEKSVDRLDNIGDLAAGLGDSAPQISRIQYAVERLGGSSDSVGSILSKMSKSLGTAAMEGGPAADAIRRIGLNVNDLRAMNPSDAFLSIVDAIGKVPSVYDRAALGADIFGKGVTEISAVLKAGEGEMLRYMERADALGITVTDSMVEKGSAAKDAMTDVSGIFQSFGNILAEEVTPGLVKYVENLKDVSAAQENIRLTARLALDVYDEIANVVGKLGGAAKLGLGALAQGNANLFNAIGRGRSDEHNSIWGNISGRPGDNDKMELMANTLKAEGWNDLMGKTEKKMEAVEESTDRATGAVKDVGGAFEAAGDRAESAAGEIVNSSDNIGKASKKMAADVVGSLQKIGIQEKILIGQLTKDPTLKGILDTYADGMHKAARGEGPGGLNKNATDAIAGFLGDAAERVKKYGEELTQSVRTPMEEYSDKLKDINAALKANAITSETAARAVKRAWEEMNEAAGEGGPNNAAMGWLDQTTNFSTPAGGFVGGVTPRNKRYFESPSDRVARAREASRMGEADPGRLSWNNEAMAAAANEAYTANDPQLDEANETLRQIRDRIGNMGMVA